MASGMPLIHFTWNCKETLIMTVRSKWMGIAGLCAAAITGAALIAAGPNSDSKPGMGRNAPSGDKAAPAAAAKVGQPAPGFSLTGVDGKTYNLNDFKGKIVVLEWFNPECPYVVKAHSTGSLKGLGNKLQKDGVAFFAINSGAPGKQGAGAELNKAKAKEWGLEYPVLIDESGTVGRSFGATNTPHMFVIAADGKLVYAGAIDDNKDGDKKAGEAMNYVTNAITQLKAGETVSPSTTKAYGCSVKYGG
jgi:peroxiredoxin